MNLIELLRDADRKLDYGEITIGEYEKMIAPLKDAVPVKHGRWKEDTGGYGFWICSACGFVSEASAANMLYKFCPVCGARMNGKDDHEKAD